MIDKSITHKTLFVYYHRRLFVEKCGILLGKGVGKMQFSDEKVCIVIRRLRKKKRMTQELHNGLAGIARSHLSMIENGTKQPNSETIWRVAIALDMKPSELVALIEAE